MRSIICSFTHMFPRAVTYFLVVIVVATNWGCDTVKQVMAGAPKPTAKISYVSLSDINLDSLGLDVGVEVTNPYSVSLPIAQLSYAIATGGNEFLSGDSTSQGLIPAGEKRVLPLATRVEFSRLLSAATGIRPGDVVPYQLDGNVAVDTDALGRIDLPIRKKGELPVPAVPKVSLNSVKWDSLGWNEATATLDIDIENTNSFPIDLRAMDYGLTLAGTQIIDAGVSQATKFRPGQSQSLSVPIRISPSQLGTAVFNVLTGSGADYRLAGNMTLGSAFGDLSLPFDSTGSAPFER